MDNNYDPNRGTSQSYIPSYGAQQPQAIFTEEKPHSEEFGSVRGTI